jgi:hypothetical protein
MMRRMRIGRLCADGSLAEDERRSDQRQAEAVSSTYGN